jgi:Putative beta-barrel porin-2, OmpL-like. bbp2
MTRFERWAVAVVTCCMLVAPAYGQDKPEEKAAEKPKTLWEEITLFSYIENSYVGNLNGTGRNNFNELRFYDLRGGYTFNMAEFSIKKDPTDARPWGFGLVVTGGEDARKNHALGIFRGKDDVFPFDETPPIDLQEAYASYKIPIGTGLTLKAGKFVTYHGYEVIESPNNLNFSRSFFFSFGIPLTHVGLMASYSPTEWLTIAAGPIVGWDVAEDNNDSMSGHGQITVTPFKDFTANLNFAVGPEQNHNNSNIRTMVDVVVAYTGIKNLTLALDLGKGWEHDEATLVASGTRQDNDATWAGVAGYAAYDWTDKFRTAARLEWFDDPQSVRTAARAPGNRTSLWETTATVQYKIWKGLVGRVEYRHDQANEKVFKVQSDGPTARNQDTISVDLYYLFF